METIGITLGIVGGLLGMFAFFGGWLVALFKYLYIDVKVLKAETKTNIQHVSLLKIEEFYEKE